MKTIPRFRILIIKHYFDFVILAQILFVNSDKIAIPMVFDLLQNRIVDLQVFDRLSSEIYENIIHLFKLELNLNEPTVLLFLQIET